MKALVLRGWFWLAGESWGARMQQLGYAGSSLQPHLRGVEGCLPGTSGAERADPKRRKVKRFKLIYLRTGKHKFQYKFHVNVPPTQKVTRTLS